MKRTYTDKTMKKKIVFPIFAECAEIVESDIFWRDRFMEYSKKVFPRNITFENNYLSFKKKVFLDINSFEDRAKLAREVMTFMRKHGNVLSESDKLEVQNIEDRINDERSNIELTWKFASKKDRKNLISNFVRDKSIQLELTQHEKAEFDLTIKQGLKENRISDNDITVDNNQITDISCLEFDFLTRKFSLPPPINRVIRNCSRARENSAYEKDTYVPLKKKYESFLENIIEKAELRMRNIEN